VCVSSSDEVGDEVADPVLVAVVVGVVRSDEVVPGSDPVERPRRPASQPLVRDRVLDENDQRQVSSALEVQQ